MKLIDEIKQYSKRVNTTEMRMSIGELINLYKDEEIVINPEFQRLFRWGLDQKTKFIESILIGIPIPSIFVQQNEDGTWEVVDGLQRLSTIFEFVGILKENDGSNNARPPICLQRAKFLVDLEDMYYDKVGDARKYFDKEAQLIFKRASIPLVIIKRESNDDTKYELFDRLNSTGSPLTSQEIRNAIMLNIKPKIIELIKKLAQHDSFINTTNLSENDISQAYDDEMVLRYFAYASIPEKFGDYNDSINDFLDGYINDHFDETKVLNMEDEFKKFFNTMDTISTKIFHGKKSGFSIGKYEALIIGLNSRLQQDVGFNRESLKDKIINMQSQDWFADATKGGSNARKRLKKFLEYSPDYFRECFYEN